MSTREITCVTLRCDSCGDECRDDDEEFRPHWPSVEEARKAVSGEDGWGWQITDDEDTCRRCVIRREHEANGHDWSDWQPIEQVDGLGRRFCWHFDGGAEYRRHGRQIADADVEALVAEAYASARGEGGAS